MTPNFEWAEVNLRVDTATKAQWKRAAGERNLSAWIRDACNEKLLRSQAGPSNRPKPDPGACEKHGLKHCYGCRTGRYA